MDNELIVLTGTNTNETTNTLTWNAVDGATSYTIYRSGTNDGEFVQIGTSTTPTYEDSNLTANTTYFYRVTATVDTIEGEPSNVVVLATATEVPATQPTVVANNITPTTARITWNQVDNATTYLVSRATTEAGPFTQISNTTNTFFDDTNLTPNTTYYYTITPTNQIGNGTASAPTQVDTTAITPPTDLLATVVDNDNINLTWNTSELSDYYLVYRSLNPEGPFTVITNTVNNNYLDENLTPNTTYYYRVSNVYQGVISEQTPTVLATTTLDDNVPATPTNVVVTPRSCSSILITWPLVDNAFGYYIYQGNTENGPFNLIGTATGNQFIMSNLQNNREYFYQVVAFNEEGLSLPSVSVSATTSATCVNCYNRVCRLVNNNGLYRCYSYVRNRCTFCCE